jgi:thioredoxin-like negative regulator of GroEL
VAPGGDRIDPAEALEAARGALRRPDPVGALALLERAASGARRGDRLAALRLMAPLLLGLGLPWRAAQAQLAVLAERPEETGARFHLARCCLALGWYDRALAELAALPQPLAAWWESFRGEVRAELSVARREVRRLLAKRRAPGWTPRAELVLGLMRCGRLAAAEGLLARARADDPTVALAAALLALRRGATPASLGALPPLAGAAAEAMRINAARLALEAGRTAEALAILPVRPGAEAGERLARARALLLGGDLAALAAEAEAGMRATPEDPWPAYVRVTAAAIRGEVNIWRVAPPAAARPLPLTIVQFWHDPAPPPDVLATLESWRTHNPAATILRHDDVSARAEIAAHAPPGVLAAYDAAHHPAMRSDILRLVVLHRVGGLYVDADEHCLRPVDDLAARLPGCVVAAPYADEVPYYLYNGILLAEAGSPVLRDALDAIAAEIPPLLAAGKRPRISNATGPGLLTRIVARRIARGEAAGIAFMCRHLWRDFAQTATSLAYKRAPGGDWRRA